ncbi:MAG: response regulator [Oliverpabstia sp.]|nr:response regulator [Lachnospiraceae bacterium]MDY5025014.1 response regulator [Oliverpabstia sp.]
MWKVLLADDEPFVREGLKELIPWEELGYSLEGCYKNGKEILESIPQICPDLVILDIQMPVMDGLEAAKLISEKWPQITVILLTAYSEFQYAKQAIDYRVSSYVMKRNVLEDLPGVLLKMKQQLEQTHGNKKEKSRMMSLLLHESEYIDPLSESSEGMYSWFEEHFKRFRMLVVQGCRGEKESGEPMKEQMQEKINTAFAGWEIQVLVVSVMEYVILVAVEPEEEEELKSRCHSLLSSGGEGTLLLAVSRIYQGIDKVSRAYREILNYLSTHFLDWNESEPNLIFTDRESAAGDEEISLIINQMIIAMESGDESKAGEETNRFSNCIRKYSDVRIRSACMMLLAECRRVCREFGWKDEEILHVTHEEGDTRIFRSTSISDLVGWLRSCVLTVAEKTGSEKENEDDLISRTKAFVEKNYARKLTLDDVAGAVYVNKSYLSRVYKQKTGENLFDTINRRKMQEAKRQIAEGKKKIWEIAELVGVEDTAYFSKMFKRYTGLSPKEYERSLRG